MRKLATYLSRFLVLIAAVFISAICSSCTATIGLTYEQKRMVDANKFSRFKTEPKEVARCLQSGFVSYGVTGSLKQKAWRR